MGFHFLTNDHCLRHDEPEGYASKGLWLPAGWLPGPTVDVPDPRVDLPFAFLAGGMVLNVLDEELPEDLPRFATRYDRLAANLPFAVALAAVAAFRIRSGPDLDSGAPAARAVAS